MVVSSLVTTTLRARPSSARSVFSSFSPTFSEMTSAPVRMAMSVSIASRRSPKPGALTATDLKVPRILLTTRVASASPSTSSAMIASGLPDCMTFSSSGSRSLTEEIFEHGFHALGVGHEVGRDVALVEAHALGELKLEAEGVALLDGDDAFLAHLVHRLGDHLADRGVASGDRGRGSDLLLGLHILGELGQFFADPLHRGLDAALERHRVGARRDVAQALTDQRLGQHRRRRGAITSDVVGLLGD